MDAEARTYQSLAEEQAATLDRVKREFEQRLQILQSQLDASQKATQQVTQSTQAASRQLVLNEELTRILIDQQLIEAGWQADTQELTYAKGARPEKGKNLAIAEWPTLGNEAADYLLFAGLTPIAVVEAKRENTNVAGKIPQAERYSRGYRQLPDSGTWFRDRAPPGQSGQAAAWSFHSPAGLLDQLTRSKAAAESQIAAGRLYLPAPARLPGTRHPGRGSRPWPPARSNCLLAMATGTGKTRTIIGLMYRLLKAERFRRILFLVDRTPLGQQAQDAFNEARWNRTSRCPRSTTSPNWATWRRRPKPACRWPPCRPWSSASFGSDKPPPAWTPSTASSSTKRTAATRSTRT
jgi:type I restriction enzyme R subunit